MKWAICGLCAIAQAQAGLVHASPQNSDVWIGLDNSDNGFLLDEQTGGVWMTGPCLKEMANAVRSGDRWVSHTVEMVSVGRLDAQLDQRITLILAEDSPAVEIDSAGRGGLQSFPAVMNRNCAVGGTGKCSRLIASQVACQG